MIPFSILDLSIITQGSNAAQSFRNSRDLAQHAEHLGFHRYWVAEHHGMPGIASAATSVLIGHIAGGTKTIRVGAGGIMLPNHSPLAIAEQFGTLESLYPKRIDLGLGRAPGSDSAASRAMRRHLMTSSDEFPQDVVELMNYMSKDAHGPVIAVPGAGLEVPVWILGSSLFGAQLAAALGLPFAFASHFAPAMMMRAVEIYRAQFSPSAHLDKPYVMLAMNVIAADTDDEAHWLASSMQRSFVNIRSGNPTQFPPPVKDFMHNASPQVKALLDSILSCTAIGSAATIKDQLRAFIQKTGADELIIPAAIFDHQARRRSYEITAAVHAELAQESHQKQDAATAIQNFLL
jgi:luciferase family oxidoreductase group 1